MVPRVESVCVLGKEFTGSKTVPSRHPREGKLSGFHTEPKLGSGPLRGKVTPWTEEI